MSDTDELSLVVQQQQLNLYSIVTTDNLTFSIDNISDIILKNNHFRNKFQLSVLTYTIIFGLICACLCFLTVTGNLLVLITFRRMRTVGNLFILSLATADLIVGCFVMPLAGIYAIMEKWQMGLVLCQIWISVDFIASTASIFNLLTLSLDRYWSITSPLQYLGKRTRTRALLLIGFAWGLSLLWVIPIFGWHRFSKDSVRSIEPDKCEPEYTHSKVFKVTTAILNFYLPLFVLMSLNGRIYYEIKRRYKNVLLQRHSTKMNDSITNTNTNSLYNHKLKHTKTNSPPPLTVTVCDSDRQFCSTTINYTENDSLVLSKISSKAPVNESILRINFKEKKTRPIIQIQSSEQKRASLKQTYSYVDKNHCTQDELTWFAHHREHAHAPFTPTSPIILGNYVSHRRCANKTCFTNTNNYHSTRIYSKKQKSTHNSPYYQTSYLCRHCSLLDRGKTSSSSSSLIPPTQSTTMNIFNLCHCCSAATSPITIHSNPFVNNNINSTMETYVQKRRMSTSSSSSVVPSTMNRKSHQPRKSSLSRRTPSPTSSLMVRSNSPNVSYQTNNKIKQTTVWNQQEKAFRQLFAIVFGFTCCFLPYFIIYMVVAFCESCVSERLLTASIWLGYVNSTINPFLYALSNKHFRRTFSRLIRRNNHPQSFYN